MKTTTYKKAPLVLLPKTEQTIYFKPESRSFSRTGQEAQSNSRRFLKTAK
jgi:hypothetical protein